MQQVMPVLAHGQMSTQQIGRKGAVAPWDLVTMMPTPWTWMGLTSRMISQRRNTHHQAQPVAASPIARPTTARNASV